MAAPAWMASGGVGWPPNGLSGGMHTRLLGFVKTALMSQLVPPNSLVCDLFCGRGLDTERWAEAGIGRYIGVDLSTSALEEAREQWEQRDRPFPAEFCELDPCMVDLEAHLQDQGVPADVVSCLAHLQDAFTSEEMVKRLLKNVEAVLKPGGFFFGTAPDSSTIWYKYQKAVPEAMKAGSLRVNGTLPVVRTEVYKINFDDDRFLPFGSKYHIRFTDDGLPPQSQLLVHFPSLIRLAREVGLECVEIQNLNEFYEDYSGPFADVVRSCCGSLMDAKGVPVLDAKGRLNTQAMDVLGLYTTFVFKKGNLATSSSMEPAFEASNSAAKYLTNFPCQHSGKLSYSEEDEPGGNEQVPLKIEELVPSMLNSTSPSNDVQTELVQLESDLHNNEPEGGDPGEEDLSASRPHPDIWPDREEEVFEVMHEASPGKNSHQNSGALDHHTEGQSDGFVEEDLTNGHSRGSSGSSLQADRILDDGHPPGEQLFEHPAGEPQPRYWPSKEASNSDVRDVSSAEREQSQPELSPSVGQRATRGFSTSGPSADPSAETEQGQLSLMEIESVERLTPACQTSSHGKARNENLDEISGIGEHQDPPSADRSPPYDPRGMSERTDESSRGGEDFQEPPLADRSPKHYMRRGHEKSNRGDSQQESSHGDHTSRHYLRRTYETRDDTDRPEKQQEQQRSDHHSKRHQQRTFDSLDHSNNRRNKKDSPPRDPSQHHERRTNDGSGNLDPSQHYERRTNDGSGNLDDRSRNNTKPPEPLGRENSSKHYTRRPSEGSEERHRSDQHYDKGRLHTNSDRSTWAGRSGSQQEFHDGLPSSQGGRSSRIVLKKFPASSGKPNARTPYGEDDVMTPHSSNK